VLPKLRICCIINNRSGTAGNSRKIHTDELFAKHGIKAQILEPRDSSSITTLARDAIQKNYDVIVAGGGDGTVNAVASALVGNSAIKFGILPMGTFNHFARGLGIPTDLEKAVEIIVAGQVKSVDVGEVNGRIFVNNSSLGLYPAMVRLREGLQKSGHSKWLAVLLASLRIITRFRRLRLELHPATGAVLKRNTPMLFVGNNAYEASLTTLGTRASLDRGQLWVMMPTATSRWGLMTSLFAILSGHEKVSDAFTFEATNLIVSSNRRVLKVAVDGEVLQLKTPLNYRTRPKSLQVIVPAAIDHGCE
jgi:YegS/Rv2252/BmrU family lipid kinase